MNQNGGIHKGGFAVLCHRNGGSESPGILTKAKKTFGFSANRLTRMLEYNLSVKVYLVA